MATWRVSWGWIGASLLRDLPGLVMGVLVLIEILPAGFFVPPALSKVIVGIGITLALIEPWVLIATKRLSLNGVRLVLREGLLFPKVLDASVGDITAVSVKQPWAMRLFGLAEISISLKGSARPFRLAGVSASSLKPLLELVHPEEECDEATRDSHRGRNWLSGREILSSFAGDIPITLVSVAVGYEAVSNVDELVGVGEGGMGSGWLHLLVIFLLVVLVATLHRYSALHGFCLESISSGWTVRSGLLDKQSYELSSREPLIITVVRGPVDALLDTSRISIGLPVPDGRDIRTLRFPALRTARAEQFLVQLTGERIPALSVGERVWMGIDNLLILVWIGAVVWVVASGVGWKSLLVAAGVAVLIFFLVRFYSTRFRLSSDYLVIERWGFASVWTWVPRQAWSWHCITMLPSRKELFITVAAFAHRSVQVRALARHSSVESVKSWHVVK